MTLDELLQKMASLDNDIIEMTIDEQLDLGDSLKDKIDAYREAQLKFEQAAESVSKKIEDLTKTRQAFEARAASIGKLLMFNMRKHGFEKLPGVEYVAHIGRTKSCVVSRKCDAADFIDWSDYVRAKYEWDKTKIKAEFEKNPKLSEIASMAENEHIKFTRRTTL